MIGAQLRRLGKHSAIYGLGGLVSRILAVLLLPLYTSYLTPADYGRVETLVALSAILVMVLRAGISTAFFRFYFDSPEPADRVGSSAPRSGSRWRCRRSGRGRRLDLRAGALGALLRSTTTRSCAPRSSACGRR